MAVTMHYRVDFYDGAIADDKIMFSLEPSTTPLPFAIGDFVDPSGWAGKPLPPERHYEITAVEHQLTCPGGDECQHNIAVSIKSVARQTLRQPKRGRKQGRRSAGRTGRR